ncbi:hypothetical protein NE865_10269 [Phthorimaea operculella]|nr:hypothetical protein NE865_10269 [Phthorimaea operculella]
MGEPQPPDKDRGGLGGLWPGLNLPVGSTISVVTNDELSKMDTDGSVSSRAGDTEQTGRKRTRYIRICRVCSKRRKKTNNGQPISGDICQCENIASSSNENTIVLKKVTPVIESPTLPQKQKSPPNVQPVDGHSKQIPQHVAQTKSQLDNSQNNAHQGRQNSRTEYLRTDVAPYLIHVQRIESSPNDGTILHPITFGNLLRKMNCQNVIPGSVKRIGRNRCAVAFSKYSDANDFLSSSLLEMNKLKAFIPTFHVTRMGLVRGIPIEWDEEEIKDNITTPIGCGNIIKVRRLNYKVNIDGNTSWKPSQSVVVTFDGQVLPKRLFMCYNALPVEVYVYPTIQCFRCCKYGHTKMQCRSKSPKCFKCSKDHLGETCTKEEGSASCVMCGGRHFATDKACPENIRQKEIKHTMAHSCISYLEASKLFPPVSRSFADVVASEPNESINEEKNSPSRISYKKTVFKKPRSPPKTQGGYDRAAHSVLLKEFEAPPSENGCAYAPKDSESEDFDMSLILTILNIILKKKLSKPSHVAPILDLLDNLCNNSNGFQTDSMELQERNS